MARALIAALALLLVACGGPQTNQRPALEGGPRTYTLVAWFDGDTTPGLTASYRLDRGAASADGEAFWEGQRAAWIVNQSALYLLAPDGRIGGFPQSAPAELVARWPILADPDPLTLLDPEVMSGRLVGCTKSAPRSPFDWTHQDPLVEDGSENLRETLTGVAVQGICGGLPLRGELWRDAADRLRLVGLELPGLRLEWSDLGPGPTPRLLAPAAQPLDDIAAFLGLR